MLAKVKKTEEAVVEKKSGIFHIPPPNMGIASFHLIGTSPLMVSAFTQKAINKMKEVHEAGSRARSKKTREARNFEADYEAAFHRSHEGWAGMPAGAFRTAMVDSCRLVGFAMTKAKLAIFIEHDGLDTVTQVPLVKIIGKPEMRIKPERNENGSMDLRSRPVWEAWEVDLRLRFDLDMFGLEDVTNLLSRAGMQVGIGEGRPNSRNSTGIGFGLWEVDMVNIGMDTNIRGSKRLPK